MRKVSYYPGCSLEGTARDYSESIHAVCRELGIDLEELEDWNCCGATAAHSIDHEASIELAGRNLTIAASKGQDLVVPCPLCFNRLKTAEKARSFYNQKTGILDLADFMSRDDILDLIESRVTRPLSGIKAVCYYGCMSSRPPGITDAAACENPTSMDRIMDRLGAEVIPWSYKTDCCGASHVIARQDIVLELVKRLYAKADAAGANCIVVSCQMCQANLDMYQEKICRKFETEYYLPIIYFTEMIGLAMAHRGVKTWFSRHFVEPDRLLAEAGLV
ncbi:MAG: disulfide reductase [Desulfobacterales bacterium C00003106]|jgi:heterodisulfide reductase subunit B|nr:MAG: disulfide reductase [Desulfobacterales bacterium C00003106]OEU60430.1 MAG: disulfide reductase [Desulfobacterales bacterium C00003104]